VHGSKAVGEPPLMLAISVREALRDAVAAFATTAQGPPAEVTLALPATPEAVFWAIERAQQAARAPQTDTARVSPSAAFP